MAEVSAPALVSADEIKLMLSEQQFSNGPAAERSHNQLSSGLLDGVVQGADAESAVSEMGVSEIQEPIYLVEDAGLIENEKFSDGDTKENIRELLETEKKMENKPRRRRGKHRKNKDTVNCVTFEKKNKDTVNCVVTFEKREKKGPVYSRKEMEALRFEDLDGQKKKWLEVYCGLCPSVALEYDDLVNSETNLEPSICFDFDPRPHFQKTSTPAFMGADCCHPPDNNNEHLNPLETTYSVPVNDEISCSGAEEEEYSHDYSSDGDYSSIQKPAFLVTGEPDFDSGPPQDGMEYLRRVRWESLHIPDVTIAKIEKSKCGKEQTLYMPQIPEIMDCPENLLPLKQWEDCFLAYFSELRLGFSQLDLQGSNAENSVEFQSIVLGYIDSVLSGYDPDPSEASFSTLTPEEPSTTSENIALSSILEMDSAARTSMLKKRIKLMHNMTTLRRNDFLWIFALCVAVDSPFDADTSASLRSLLRKCASLRASKTNADDEVVMLNILATISGRYFGQLEK